MDSYGSAQKIDARGRSNDAFRSGGWRKLVSLWKVILQSMQAGIVPCEEGAIEDFGRPSAKRNQERPTPNFKFPAYELYDR